jgi:hypothetical protein
MVVSWRTVVAIGSQLSSIIHQLPTADCELPYII